MDLSALKNKVATTDDNSSEEEKVEQEVEEKTYQTYRSGLENQRIIMRSGKVIRVTGHKYITDNKEEIAFLDEEITLGFPGLRKGEPVTETDLDPMAALRKRIAAEEREKIMKEIDAGNSETQKIVPANTAELVNLSAGSNSASSE